MLKLEYKRKKIILYKNNDAIGYCKYKENHGKIIIVFLFIEKEYRRNGYATMLIHTLLQLYKKVCVYKDYCTENGYHFFNNISTYYNIEIL